MQLKYHYIPFHEPLQPVQEMSTIDEVIVLYFFSSVVIQRISFKACIVSKFLLDLSVLCSAACAPNNLVSDAIKIYARF